MPKAVIIDLYDTLTDEWENDREGIALLRQIVAQNGVRVPESAVQHAETLAVQSFSNNLHESMIFALVDRDPELGLRCISAYRKTARRNVKIRDGAAEVLHAFKQRGMRTVLTQAPTDDEVSALKRGGLGGMIDIVGPPANARIQLPDARVLEFLAGKLGLRDPHDVVVLGTRIDRVIRPANLLRMISIRAGVGYYGSRQVPRDMKDVPGYFGKDLYEVANLVPHIR